MGYWMKVVRICAQGAPRVAIAISRADAQKATPKQIGSYRYLVLEDGTIAVTSMAIQDIWDSGPKDAVMLWLVNCLQPVNKISRCEDRVYIDLLLSGDVERNPGPASQDFWMGSLMSQVHPEGPSIVDREEYLNRRIKKMTKKEARRKVKELKHKEARDFLKRRGLMSRSGPKEGSRHSQDLWPEDLAPTCDPPPPQPAQSPRGTSAAHESTATERAASVSVSVTRPLTPEIVVMTPMRKESECPSVTPSMTRTPPGNGSSTMTASCDLSSTQIQRSSGSAVSHLSHELRPQTPLYCSLTTTGPKTLGSGGVLSIRDLMPSSEISRPSAPEKVHHRVQTSRVHWTGLALWASAGACVVLGAVGLRYFCMYLGEQGWLQPEQSTEPLSLKDLGHLKYWPSMTLSVVRRIPIAIARGIAYTKMPSCSYVSTSGELLTVEQQRNLPLVAAPVIAATVMVARWFQPTETIPKVTLSESKWLDLQERIQETTGRCKMYGYLTTRTPDVLVSMKNKVIATIAEHHKDLDPQSQFTLLHQTMLRMAPVTEEEIELMEVMALRNKPIWRMWNWIRQGSVTIQNWWYLRHLQLPK